MLYRALTDTKTLAPISERLTYRIPEENDAGWILRENAGNVRAWFGAFDDEHAAREWITLKREKVANDLETEFVVADTDGTPIGMISTRLEDGRYEVGLWVSTHAQGKGYGTEMLRAILTHHKRYFPNKPLFYTAAINNKESTGLVSKFITIPSAPFETEEGMSVRFELL